MAIYQIPKKKSGFLGMLQLASMFIPGMQVLTPFISAANMLSNGNPAGAMTAISGSDAIQNLFGGGDAAATRAMNQESLFGKMQEARQASPDELAYNAWSDKWGSRTGGMVDDALGHYLLQPKREEPESAGLNSLLAQYARRRR
jgi:hypothetical protein